MGNVYTGSDLGGIVRLGYNIPTDFGPARPSGANSDSLVPAPKTYVESQERNFSVYIFVGAKGSLVLHNIFLDGSTFQDSIRVTRVPLQAEYEGGFSVQYKEIGITWREVTRTAEFYERFKPHTFASVTLSFGQKF